MGSRLKAPSQSVGVSEGMPSEVCSSRCVSEGAGEAAGLSKRVAMGARRCRRGGGGQEASGSLLELGRPDHDRLVLPRYGCLWLLHIQGRGDIGRR